MKSTLEDILSKWASLPDKQRELEVRFRVTPNQFEIARQAIAKVSKGITQVTSNMIQGGIIRQLPYVNGKPNPAATVVYEKKPIADHFGHQYKVALSLEIPRKMQLSKVEKVRLKHRESYLHNDFPNWRFDFTWGYMRLIKPNENSQSVLEEIKTRILPTFLTGISSSLSGPYVFYSFEIEYIGRDMPTVDDVHAVINFGHELIGGNATKSDVELAEKLRELAKVIYGGHIPREKTSVKAIGNAAIPLTRSAYKGDLYPNMGNYYLTDKADGERCFLWLTTDGIIADVLIFTAELSKGRMQLREDASSDSLYAQSESLCAGWYVFDAELIGTKVYIFDVLIFADKPVVDRPFKERLELMQSKCLDYAGEVYSCTLKKYHLIEDRAIIERVYREPREYDIDGLMFTENERYFKMTVYKWKPPEKITVDFLLLRPPAGLLGIQPYVAPKGHTPLMLCVGVNADRAAQFKLSRLPIETLKEYPIRYSPEYFPVQFHNQVIVVSNAKLPEYDGHICEMRLVDQKWHIERVRMDREPLLQRGKLFGNDFRVADTTWMLMKFPLTFDEILEPPRGYFRQDKDDRYVPLTKFHSYVKGINMLEMKDANVAIDLCCGQGAELSRWDEMGVSHVIGVDADADALAEFQRRRHAYKSKNPIDVRYVHASILADDALAKIREALPGGVDQQVDFIMCNFAFHYLIESSENLHKVISLIDTLLKPGGKFIFTTMDGEKIYRRFIDNPKIDRLDWFDSDADNPKWSIRRKFDIEPNKPLLFGTPIEVLLPFAGGEYYPEPLVNITLVLREFVQKKFEWEKWEHFDIYLDHFKRARPEIYERLTDADKDYTSLHVVVSVWKGV